MSKLIFIISHLITVLIISYLILGGNGLTSAISGDIYVLTTLLLLVNVSLHFLSYRPEKLNYPLILTEENKNSVYLKVKILLSFITLFISILLSGLILSKFNQTELKIPPALIISYFVILSVLPIFFIQYFRK